MPDDWDNPIGWGLSYSPAADYSEFVTRAQGARLIVSTRQTV